MTTVQKVEVGSKINILMKPVLMRDWYVIKETKKCIVVRKYFGERYGHKGFLGDCYYVPKKEIIMIKGVE